jgi:aminoglycoside phosphotransferase
MNSLVPDVSLNPELRRILAEALGASSNPGEIQSQPLKVSRPVFRFTSEGCAHAVVGKFFVSYPRLSPPDRGLINEYHAYLQAPAWGLTVKTVCLPRLLGCHPQVKVGLLLEAIPGPDLDRLLAEAGDPDGRRRLAGKLAQLAELLSCFHSRPAPPQPAPARPALKYFRKLRAQLLAAGVLTHAEAQRLEAEGAAWEGLLTKYPDHQVLIHGDATPTNFLFPGGRAVALDLERLRLADRLFDLSWVAGELKHAWGWRFHDFSGSEWAIQAFFRAYLDALPADAHLTRRIYRLNPFYMALAELRIARNAYLAWDYRRALIEEARRCLSYGRRMA